MMSCGYHLEEPFSDEMMQLWSELVDVIDNISLTEESDALIWCI
jgi:hypothetical protein